MTRTGNHIYNAIMAILALLAATDTLPAAVLELIPAKYKVYVVAVPLIALWLKSHLNLEAEPPTHNQPETQAGLRRISKGEA